MRDNVVLGWLLLCVASGPSQYGWSCLSRASSGLSRLFVWVIVHKFNDNTIWLGLTHGVKQDCQIINPPLVSRFFHLCFFFLCLAALPFLSGFVLDSSIDPRDFIDTWGAGLGGEVGLVAFALCWTWQEPYLLRLLNDFLPLHIYPLRCLCVQTLFNFSILHQQYTWQPHKWSNSIDETERQRGRGRRRENVCQWGCGRTQCGIIFE